MEVLPLSRAVSPAVSRLTSMAPSWRSRTTFDPAEGSGAPAPVHIIVGTEDFLADRHRHAIVKRVRENSPTGDELTVTTVRAGDITGPELTELLSPSLFGEDRIVVITNMNDAGKEPASLVLAAAKDPAPGITLIIQHSGEGRTKAMVSKLLKLGEEHRADAIPVRELPTFVQSEFHRFRVRVSPDVVSALIESVGSDVRELASAVSQLVADNDGNVDLEAVRRYYTGTAEVSSFSIADDVIAGNVDQSVAKVRRALQLGVAHMAISTAVCRGISEVARLSGNRRIDPYRDASRLGMPPWKLKRTAPIAQRWSQAAIAEAVQVAAQMEAGIKGAAGDQDSAVELGVRRLAELARMK